MPKLASALKVDAPVDGGCAGTHRDLAARITRDLVLGHQA
jgi:hypothetical protein